MHILDGRILRCALIALLATSACVPTTAMAATSAPASRERTYENVLSPLGPTDARKLPRHRYRVTLPANQQVTISARSPGASVTLQIVEGNGTLVDERSTSADGAWVKLAVVTGKTKETASVELVAPYGDTTAKYELRIDPAPLAEMSVPPPPSPEAEKLAAKKAAAALASQQRAAARRAIDPDMIDAKQATLCKGQNKIFLALPVADEARYYFCDGTVVTRQADGTIALNYGLKGEQFEKFTAREAANLEVAQHNHRVLQSNTSERQATEAQKAFDRRVEAFMKKYRWTQDKYLQAIKTAKLETK